jgi:hypothetical protein
LLRKTQQLHHPQPEDELRLRLVSSLTRLWRAESLL